MNAKTAKRLRRRAQAALAQDPKKLAAREGVTVKQARRAQRLALRALNHIAAMRVRRAEAA